MFIVVCNIGVPTRSPWVALILFLGPQDLKEHLLPTASTWALPYPPQRIGLAESGNFLSSKAVTDELDNMKAFYLLSSGQDRAEVQITLHRSPRRDQLEVIDYLQNFAWSHALIWLPPFSFPLLFWLSQKFALGITSFINHLFKAPCLRGWCEGSWSKTLMNLINKWSL